ncbi:MAG: cohesin domain-containing protein [bacterium]|nr:cohesin domain-containing protein [bacterium]
MASKKFGATQRMEKPKIVNNLARMILQTLLFFGAVIFLFGKSFSVQAATLLLTPTNGNFSVGNNFSVSVVVSTNQAMNAAQGTITFPADKLEVVGISKNNSMFSLWVQEPFFSNVGPKGNVGFEGIKLNPGFTGNNGRIFDITFRVKSAGVAEVSFSGGSILANDGKASNIVSSFGSSVYTLRARSVPDAALPAVGQHPSSSGVTGSLLVVGNLDIPYLKHFTQNDIGEEILFSTSDEVAKWSINNYAKLAWRLPPAVTGVVALLDERSDTDPGDKPDAGGLIEQKIFPLLTEGKHYFHIRFLQGKIAGPVLHYPLFVDATAPKNFNIEFVGSELNYRGIYSTSNPRPRLAFFTEDVLSGIGRYQIKVGDGPWVNAAELAESPAFYLLPKQGPDQKQTITARAYDHAGNWVDATADVIITPIVPPVITYFTKYVVYPSDKLVIEGRSSPQANIQITLRKDEPRIIIAKADEKGGWMAVGEESLPSGTYTVTARQIVSDGAESAYTEPVYIRVNFFAARLFRFVTDFSLYLIIIIFLAVQTIMYMYYRRRMAAYRAEIAGHNSSRQSTGELPLSS